MLEKLLEDISEFLRVGGATPADIRTVSIHLEAFSQNVEYFLVV